MEKSVSFILARENHNDKLAQEFRRRNIHQHLLQAARRPPQARLCSIHIMSFFENSRKRESDKTEATVTEID